MDALPADHDGFLCFSRSSAARTASRLVLHGGNMPVTRAKSTACRVWEAWWGFRRRGSVLSSSVIVRRLCGAAITAVFAGVVPVAAQVTPAAGDTPPDDT